MKIVKVTYTIQASYAEQNQKNIKQVMDDLQKLNHHGIFYHACLSAEGKTFSDTAFYKSDDDQQVLNELPSFRHFQGSAKGQQT